MPRLFKADCGTVLYPGTWRASIEQRRIRENLTSALYSLTGGRVPGLPEPEILQAVNKCPVCGMTYEMFVLQTASLDVGECYKTFHDRLLRPAKTRFTRTYEHVGKHTGKGRRFFENIRKSLKS